MLDLIVEIDLKLPFFPPFSPGPWKEVCVRQHVLSGDFEGRKKMNA